MGFFRRSMSHGSSQSCASTDDSASDTASSRTSMDSTFQMEISDSLATITKPPPKAPILNLPLELIQQVHTYLDPASAAAFCLSSRYIYYALGTQVLSSHVEGSQNRFEKRRTIEAVVERAFPGHFFCAWCDKFHAWSPQDGPKALSYGKRRDCTDFNSYLYASNDYILRYHHVRLAINAFLWGPEHGIPLSAFSHQHKSMATIFKTPVATKLSLSAKIAQGHFLLHSSFAIVLPAFATRNRNLLKTLWPALPHILTGHRDSDNGHTGLMAAVDNVVRRGWRYPFTQNCCMCATDWAVGAQEFPHATGSQMRLIVQTWRDLGSARTPFETAWRAHGVCGAGNGSRASTATCLLHMAGLQAGAIRRAFDSAEAAHDDDDDGVSMGANMKIRSKTHGYRSFITRNTAEEDEARLVRRSSARPRYWLSKEENDAAAWRYEEERRHVQRAAAEDMARRDAQRATTFFSLS